MHYIRLLRPPSLEKKQRLKIVLTITTDLGDSFFCPEQPLPVSIYAQRSVQEAPHQIENQVKIDNGSVLWRSGLRVLKLELQLPIQIAQELRTAESDKSPPRIRIFASHQRQDPPDIADIPFDTEGRVLGLSVPLPRPATEICYTATREFISSDESVAGMLSIDEEIGESIDRHVWDAGVVTTGLIFDMCKTGKESKWHKTPQLRSILSSSTPERPLHAIELGCGVGILSVGLAVALSAQYRQQTLSTRSQEDEPIPAGSDNVEIPVDAVSESPKLGSILLTDLPDAEELTMLNISRYKEAQGTAGSRAIPLDFESLDWEDGKNGVFGPKAIATRWDLIIISDCTYNVDMLSALVETLSKLHDSSVDLAGTGPKVMLATKPRHSSEKALFDLMTANGWDILESASQPLPSVGLEDERVEIYLFGKAAKQGNEERNHEPSMAKRRKLK